MTTLEASTLCLAHFDGDFKDKSPRRATGRQSDASFPVSVSAAQSKFGGQALDAYTAFYGSLVFDNAAPCIDGGYLTLEAWVYFRTHRGGGANPMVLSSASGTNFRLAVRMNDAGVPSVLYRDSGNNDNILTAPSALATGQWHHLCCTLDKYRTRRLYVNGALVVAGNGVVNSPVSAPANGFYLGSASSGLYSPDCLIDEARAVAGVPVHEVPAEVQAAPWPDSAGGDASFAAVSLLLHGEGSNGGTTLTDSSSNALVATQIGTGGNVTTSTTKARHGSSALRLAGAQAISYAANALFEAASRNWTIECWVNVDTGLTGVRHVWQLYGASVNFRLNLYYDAANGVFGVYSENGGGTGGTRVSAAASAANTWVHVGLSKEGNAFTLWIDGQPVATGITTVVPTGNLGLCIGTQNFTPLATDYYVGYLDEVRVTMGVARNPLAFTPPTAAYADCPVAEGRLLDAPLARQAGAFPGVTPKLLDAPLMLRDMQAGGRGVISGTVKVKGTPNFAVHRKVWLLRESDAQVIRETWSDATTGAYTFSGVDERQRYTVITYDHLHNFRAVIADNLTPDLMP
jgi:hypothetical protein